MNRFLEQFDAFVRTQDLVKAGDHILLAVSGGIDSMVMLDLFARRRKLWNLTLSAAHVNHQLRGAESDADERLVADTAAGLSIPFFSTRADVKGFALTNKLGKQDAARRLRYQFFEEIRQRIGADSTATAHTADDNAETVLHHIARGTGLHGLTGIPVKRVEGNIIRPQLFAYRRDVCAYADHFCVIFREDASNASLAYRRNRIRHSILPALRKQFDKDIVGSLNRLSQASVRLRSGIDRMMANRSGDESVLHPDGLTIIELRMLLGLPTLLRSEYLAGVLRSSGVEITESRVQRVMGLLEKRTGTRIPVGEGVSAIRERNAIVVFRRLMHRNNPAADDSATAHILLEAGQEAVWNGSHIAVSRRQPYAGVFPLTNDEEFADASKFREPLLLRPWRKGDWFIPLGMVQRKKLSDFLTDCKMAAREKRNALVLTHSGQIVWVVGHRLDERFKITRQTEFVVKLSHHKIV